MFKIEPDTYHTITAVLEIILFGLIILLLYYLNEYYTWRQKNREGKKTIFFDLREFSIGDFADPEKAKLINAKIKETLKNHELEQKSKQDIK